MNPQNQPTGLLHAAIHFHRCSESNNTKIIKAHRTIKREGGMQPPSVHVDDALSCESVTGRGPRQRPFLHSSPDPSSVGQSGGCLKGGLKAEREESCAVSFTTSAITRQGRQLAEFAYY
ncbi:hypothetical protein CEXT_39331 [Caerostris extrusa]|uniref:Uncharacterized protein n=1 Tax=Caerostris extrusa TaxID=172846 RepID=A0AAV4UV76_CAEEX|nr:hypothetical protein CEXT_39331 [Caerostris extrusa]